MKDCELYDKNNLSYFRYVNPTPDAKQKLGTYSIPIAVKQMIFVDILANLSFDWHCAPQKQFIIYLSGSVSIEASGGETKIFNAGDVLLANDLKGKGHISTTCEEGQAIIVVAA